MVELTARSGDETYHNVLQELLQHGGRVAPRGQATLELLDVTVTITDPHLATPTGVRRGFNQRIAVAEATQLIAGVSHLAQLDLASGDRFARFADDNRLRGAYGPRLHHQLPIVARLLQEDPDTRQGVAVVWGTTPPHVEPALGSRDVPCTVYLNFRIRDGALQLKVHMRSNDAILGVPYDWFMFSRLHLLMADALLLQAGPYVHHVDSLHLYVRDQERATDLIEKAHFIAEALPAFTDGFQGWDEAVRAAEGLVLGDWVPPAGDTAEERSRNLTWYYGRLPCPQGEYRLCSSCRYVVPATETFLTDDDTIGTICLECLSD